MNLRQRSSSEPSRQSGRRSHWRLAGMQVPSRQVNSCSRHAGGAGGGDGASDVVVVAVLT